MKKHLFFTLLAFTIVAMLPTIVSAEGLVSSMQEKVYVLTDEEKKRWGISDNASNPVETTAGWNQALKWAGEQGYTTFRVEDGHYLIAKGEKVHDPKARINMVGNMKLSLSDNVILEKETNKWEAYAVLHIGNVKNVVVEGGQFLGDRETHDYSVAGEGLLGTHEWGNGINLKGSENVIIQNVKMKNFAGDSIEVGGHTVGGYYLKDSVLEKGSINDNGQFVAAEGKVRSKDQQLTNLNQKKFEGAELFMWLPNGVETNQFDIFFYDQNDKFLAKQEDIKFYTGKIDIPEKAAYYHIVVDANDPQKVNINAMYLQRSTNVSILNSDLGYSRRQGISVVGGENVKVEGNEIHHVKGTAPQSGIDLEGGYFLNHDVEIKNNHFHHNAGYDVILFDGHNAVVERNKIESNAIGLAVSKPFDYAIIRNNQFKNATLTVVGNNVDFDQNTFNDSSVRFSGHSITFKNSKLYNTPISLDNSRPFTVDMKNITSENASMYIGANPVNITDFTMTGEKVTITGPGNDQNKYHNLKVNGYTNLSLPAGTYENCEFDSGDGSAVGISKSGAYLFKDCIFNSANNVVKVSGEPEVQIRNSEFKINNDIGYGASFYVLGAKSLTVSDSTIEARNNTVTHAPIVKFGPYGSPKPSEIDDVKLNNVDIYGNPNEKNAIGIDTINSGIDAPAYSIVNLNVYNAKTLLKSTDKIQSSEDTRNKRVPKLRQLNP